MNIKGIKYVSIVTVIVFILVLVLIVTNILGHEKKLNNFKPSTTTSIKSDKDNVEVIGDKIKDVENGIVVANGQVLELKLKQYQAIVGFRINYASEYFSPVKVNTSTLALISNIDKNIFVKVELLSETNYYKEYNNSSNELYGNSKVDGYNTEYKFIRGNGLFLKITKMNKEVDELGYSNIMDFMINSLEIDTLDN